MARTEMMVPGWGAAVKQAVVLPLSMYEIAALLLLTQVCAFVCDECYKTFVLEAELRMQQRGLRPPMYEMITIGSNLPALGLHFAPNPIRQI